MIDIEQTVAAVVVEERAVVKTGTLLEEAKVVQEMCAQVAVALLE